MSSIRDEEIQNLQIGDVIYECEYGMNIEVRVTSVPTSSVSTEALGKRTQWHWTAENTQTGQVIDYLLTEGLSHYGPRLYRRPEYMHVAKGGIISFPRLGGKPLSMDEVA